MTMLLFAICRALLALCLIRTTYCETAFRVQPTWNVEEAFMINVLEEKLTLDSLNGRFTVLRNPVDPSRSMRIKKTEWCDPTVKSVYFIYYPVIADTRNFKRLHRLSRRILRSQTSLVLFLRIAQRPIR
jgi:hypothetical protein